MKNIFFPLIAVALSSLILSSCFKRDNTDWTFEQDNAISAEIYQDVYKQLDETAQTNGGLKACANVTFSDSLGAFPNTVTIDYGTGCAGADGRTRTGVITAVFNGPWRDTTTTVVTTFTNYTVDGYTVAGTVNVANVGTGPRGYLRYEVGINNGRLTYPDGNSAQVSGTTVYDFAEGLSTTFASNGVAGIEDDVYHIGGTINGVNRNGTPYTAEITEYLIRDLSCKWINKGVVNLTPQNGDTRTVDFGDGTCDDKATFSLGDFTLNFTLP